MGEGIQRGEGEGVSWVVMLYGTGRETETILCVGSNKKGHSSNDSGDRSKAFT